MPSSKLCFTTGVRTIFNILHLITKTVRQLADCFCCKCPRWDSNPHEDKPHDILSVGCLPFQHPGSEAWGRIAQRLFEASVGIEPTDKGFADPCLTTWLRRHYKYKKALGCRLSPFPGKFLKNYLGNLPVILINFHKIY